MVPPTGIVTVSTFFLAFPQNTWQQMIKCHIYRSYKAIPNSGSECFITKSTWTERPRFSRHHACLSCAPRPCLQIRLADPAALWSVSGHQRSRWRKCLPAGLHRELSVRRTQKGASGKKTSSLASWQACGHLWPLVKGSNSVPREKWATKDCRYIFDTS